MGPITEGMSIVIRRSDDLLVDPEVAQLLHYVMAAIASCRDAELSYANLKVVVEKSFTAFPMVRHVEWQILTPEGLPASKEDDKLIFAFSSNRNLH